MKVKVELKQLRFDPVKNKLKAVLRKALKTAAAPIIAAVKSEAQAVKRFGFLAASIGSKVKVYSGEKGVAVVGPKSKYTRKRKGRTYQPARYAHFVQSRTKWISKAREGSVNKAQSLLKSELADAIYSACV